MKRIMLFTLITLSLSSVFALSYSPDLSLSIATDFTHYSENIDPYDGYRDALMYRARINPFAITLENNRRLSLPVSVDYIANTKTIDRYFIQERMQFSIDLEFDYIASSYLVLSIAPGVGYTYFPRINAGNLFISLEFSPIFMVNSKHL